MMGLRAELNAIRCSLDVYVGVRVGGYACALMYQYVILKHGVGKDTENITQLEGYLRTHLMNKPFIRKRRTAN